MHKQKIKAKAIKYNVVEGDAKKQASTQATIEIAKATTITMTEMSEEGKNPSQAQGIPT